jgi:hypothetical protein
MALKMTLKYKELLIRDTGQRIPGRRIGIAKFYGVS